MGCGSSTGVEGGGPSSLTAKEVELIRHSWARFEEGDVIADASHIYMRLFETAPEAKDYFGFAKGKEVNLDNRQFKGHLRKVVDVVKGAVEGADDLPALTPILYDLGVKHKAYGVPTKYYKNIGECLLYALDKKLHLDGSTRKAWANLYSVIQREMIKGM